ncbi:winged helix-turn-helix domain-containing protein [Methylicorpusculum oleiharenae]|uniref:winged helix-turn-helix domain-containing protein n=1 Tax=Methylicorpusculum oleiharenae TaxID=1338687 RepID=UPI0013576782|nr:winged helix-turn-helix domain-containing protein [Methylicorpusculum oleiharenae]MCD2452850.1 winged helix-turn-helix domain-containing protein [Methylicorpusculum oleiharenae]
MSDVLIVIFVLYIIYLIMKKPKSTPETAVPKKPSPAQKPPEKIQTEQVETKNEVPAAPEVTPAKAAPKKSSPAQKLPKKVQAAEAKATIEVPSVAKVTPAKAAPKKPNVLQKAPKTAEDLLVEPVATSDITVKDRIGLTAGLIWQYLADHGATPVAKLMRELPEEEKIIHRSIGWLAQEGKITLDIVDRAETIALKD